MLIQNARVYLLCEAEVEKLPWATACSPNYNAMEMFHFDEKNTVIINGWQKSCCQS